MNRKKALGIAALFVLLAACYASKLLWDSGAFKTINTIHFSECTSVSPAPGSEDIAILEGTPLVAVSIDKRDEHHPEDGYILIYNTNERKLVSISETGIPKNFHPHGIDVIANGANFTIAAISQNSPTETRVELLEYDPQAMILTWKKSITSPDLLAANDLVLLSENEFLYTRDFNTKDPFRTMLQQYGRQATGSIWHFKNDSFSKKASNLFFGNGIVFDKANSIVYAAEMAGRKVHSYRWSDSNLIPLNEIDTPHAIDNITLSANSVIGAGHPKLLALKKMRDHRDFKAPSTVVEFSKDLKTYKVIYEDDGKQIAASSVALSISPSEILVGSVFDDHFLHCKK